MNENVTLQVDADTGNAERQLKNLEALARNFGVQMTGALKDAAVSGKSFEDILRRIGLSLASMALNQALDPLQGIFSSLFQGLFGAIIPHAKGGVVPFASGGVISAPTYFPLGSSLGLMGEAGSEAILPLQRGADGSLGVAAQGGGRPVNIVFNVTTPDPPSFRRSESQVTGMLARAVSRGMRRM